MAEPRPLRDAPALTRAHTVLQSARARLRERDEQPKGRCPEDETEVAGVDWPDTAAQVDTEQLTTHLRERARECEHSDQCEKRRSVSLSV